MSGPLPDVIFLYAILAGVFIAVLGAVGWCASALMGHPSDRVGEAFGVMFCVGMIQAFPLTVMAEFAVLTAAALALAMLIVAAPFAIVGWVVRLCYMAMMPKKEDATK